MSDGMPLISVIVPVYNVGEYLIPCLNSLMAQSYQNLEILLIDDGSTDGSGKCCDEYATKDNRFKVIHKNNGGVSSARNLGLDMAQGEYIAFVDADDYVATDCLQTLYQDITEQTADMVCCNFTIVDGQHNHLLSHSRGAGGEYPNVKKNRIIQGIESIFRDYFCGNEMYWSHVIAALFRSKLLDNCRFEGLKYYEDGLFMFDLFCKNPTVYLDIYAGYFYVERANSATRVASKYSLQPKIDDIRFCRHRYDCIRDISPKSMFCKVFLAEYADSIHAMALALAQQENKQRRKEYNSIIVGYLEEVLTIKSQLPSRIRRRLVLRAKAPWLYNIIARLHRRIRG